MSLIDYVLTDITSANTDRETKIDETEKSERKIQSLEIKRYTQISIPY